LYTHSVCVLFPLYLQHIYFLFLFYLSRPSPSLTPFPYTTLFRSDGVDSLTRQEMDITPFKNILNDMYSRDISKKVLAGRMTRSRQGKFCGGQPPLGLMRDPEDKGHLILDPETAPVIRKIYDMALDGWGCMRIAKQLMDDKIPITRVKSNTECDVNYYSWGSARISHILRN